MKVQLLLVCLILAGCTSPTTREKGAVVESKDYLKDKHYHIVCDFVTDGNEGNHVKVADCTGGKIVPGVIQDATVAYDGQDDCSSGVHRRSTGEISLAVYYPSPAGNSRVFSAVYCINGGGEGDFTATIDFPLQAGLGTYPLHIVGTNYDSCGGWVTWGTYKACKAKDTDETKNIVIDTKGFL